MMQQQQGGNVYNTSANAYNGAVNGTNAAMMGNAMAQPAMASTTQAQSTGYTPFTGLDANGAAMTGFGAGQASGGGYTAAQMDPARDVTAGQFATTDISQYMNPYTQNVVDQTAAEMERARLIEQNSTNDAMTAAGAFGGSRHGIANAETNRGFYDMLGQTVGNLNNQGYVNAQQAAFQDIGNTLQADAMNQQSDLTTGQANMNATNTAAMTGANNATSASIANANGQTQLANSRFNAVNDASRFGADAANNASQFNAGNLTDTSRFNAGNYNDFQNNRFSNQMAGASQLGGLSSLGFNMGNTVADRQAADGAQAQDIQQQLMDLAQQQWSGYTGAAQGGLAGLQSGVNSIPGGTGATSSSSNPGILGILSGFL